MRPITDLVGLIDAQFDSVSTYAGIDGYYADVPPKQWGQPRLPRRGWTRRDMRWHDQADIISDAKPWQMPQLPKIERRVAVGFRVLRKWQREPVIAALRTALDYCAGKPHLAAIESMLVQMVEHHLLWMNWMKNQDFSDAPNNRANLRLQLSGALKIVESLPAEQDDAIEFALVAEGKSRLLLIYKELRNKKGRYVTLDRLTSLQDDVSSATIETYVRQLNTVVLDHGQEIESPRGQKKYLLRSISDTGVRK